jgi:3-oxoadipate enol-lactonase
MLRKIQLEDVALSVTETGDGPPLVLVHGYPLSGLIWETQVEALAATRRVIVPDLRGFGGSGVTPGTVTMERFADDLAELLDELNVREPIVLCGLSMGGYVALAFWHKYADRLRGLVLTDTRATADIPEAAEKRLEMAVRVEREGPAPQVAAMRDLLFADATRASQPELVTRVEKIMLATPGEGVAAAARGMAARRDWSDRLGHIAVPTLVICGAHDVITPPDEMRRMAGAIPRATYVELADAGHMANMEDPAGFNAALKKFLTALD